MKSNPSSTQFASVQPPDFYNIGLARSSWRGGIAQHFYGCRRENEADDLAVWLSFGRQKVLSLVAGFMVAVTVSATVFGALPLVENRPSVEAIQLQQQQLIQIFKEKVPAGNVAMAEKAARDFIERLQNNSPIIAEKLKQGQLDEDELRSRVEIFLREHPELADGHTASAIDSSPRDKVANILRHWPQTAGNDSERLVLADRFLARLMEHSKTAYATLISDKMSDEELQSCVEVFLADIHGDTVAVPADPKAAALSNVINTYLKTNYGLPTERAGSLKICGVVESAGSKREFVIFRKRPDKIRVHIINDGLVVGIIAYDGNVAWRQEMSRPAQRLFGIEADAIADISRFDDPLINYRERGAEVQLDDKAEKNMIWLRISENNGAESVIELDASTFIQQIQRTRIAGGEWVESHYSDYRKSGSLNYAFLQEELKNGKISSITRISEITSDPGLLDQFFIMPTGSVISYMDYMGGLAMVKNQSKTSPLVLPHDDVAVKKEGLK